MNKYKLSKAGINAKEGIHRLAENESLYEHYLYTFPEDPHYQQMLDGIEAGDAEAAFQASHAMKGLVGNLGMTDLFTAVVPLVEDFRPRVLEGYEQHLAEVKEKYEIAVTAIKEQRGDV